MTDEVDTIELPADTSVPDQVATAAPEPVEETPDDNSPKTFTQEELDAIVGKRLAREQRKWERENPRKAEPQVAIPAADALNREDFASDDDYLDAVAEQKADAKLAAREAAKQQSEIAESYQAREEEARDKYDDFEQVAYNPKLTITDTMAEVIKASEIGPDIIYDLGLNPDEAKRIARLSPFLQAKEIGRIEAKLAAAPPVKKTSTAPAPISPVSARANGTPAYDTTDPRSIKTMSTSEWIEADRRRQMKLMQARH